MDCTRYSRRNSGCDCVCLLANNPDGRSQELRNDHEPTRMDRPDHCCRNTSNACWYFLDDVSSGRPQTVAERCSTSPSAAKPLSFCLSAFLGVYSHPAASDNDSINLSAHVQNLCGCKPDPVRPERTLSLPKGKSKGERRDTHKFQT